MRIPNDSSTEKARVTSLEPQSFRNFNQDLDPALHSKLGSHRVVSKGQVFTQFSVWAPTARQVTVIGDFNEWNSAIDPLFPIENTGVWTTLIPGPLHDQRYQFSIVGSDGQLHRKTDPFASRYASETDRSAVVAEPFDFSWNDQEWLERRSAIDWPRAPISIYELHLGSWRKTSNSLTQPESYRHIAKPLANHVKRLGFTHVLFMPLMEHPYDGSWGYQVTGYFAATNRYGTPEDLAFLVDTLHQHDIGVLFDWVPAHFPKDEFALYQFDGSPCFENACPQQGHHPDWGTAIFDYRKPQVLSFLISSALYWIDTFHFDGIRVDAVASMIYRDYSRPSGDWTPNIDGGIENLETTHFIRLLNDQIGHSFPGVIRIAEESTPWPGVTRSTSTGGLGFDFKWNLGWMHDTLTYFAQGASDRHHSRSQLILPASYQQQENFCLPFSHDEVVHGKAAMLQKMPGDSLQAQAAQLRSLYAWMWAWPGKKLQFMGNEFASLAEWNHEGELDWECAERSPHRGIQRLIAFLNAFYQQHPFLAQTDVLPSYFSCPEDGNGDKDIFRFVRSAPSIHDTLICLGNFSETALDKFRVGVPSEGTWKIQLNSSWLQFDGLEQDGNLDLDTEAIPCHELDHSISLDLPAHSTLYLAPLHL